MRKILAIGGAVIKTARNELHEVIEKDKVEMLIHNGGSVFHDFQLATETLQSHSHSLDDLLQSYECNAKASHLLWEWFSGANSPKGSITNLCENRGIPVLMFTGLACDFWQLFNDSWEIFAKRSARDFSLLCTRFLTPFHYVCMGSAVIQPEVFTKAIAISKSKDFTSDVVDFLDMYRPRTRVAKFGTYYQMTHKEYLKGLI